jgi:hypothetical protein
MEFQKKDLLSFKDFKRMLTTDFPNEKAELLCTTLKKYMIIKQKKLYIMQPNITYQHFDDDKSKIVQLCTLFVELSFRNLNEMTRFNIELRDDFEELTKLTKETKPFNNSYYERILPQIKNQILNEKLVFDINLEEMHFENGYMNFKTLEFKKRDRDVHFITNCINRDYKPSSLAQQAKIRNIFKQIYPNDNDFEYITRIIASGLTGRSIKDCEMLFLLGAGSAGKSTVLLLTQLAIDCYLEELNSDTFSYDNKNSDKIINTFSYKPYVRIAWINELKDTRLNESLFKTFCEGVIQTCKLYQEGSHSIIHCAKPIITANTLPVFKIDSGMTRRISAYEHNSLFVDNPKLVDIAKNIYLKDNNLLATIQSSNDLKNAWFDILSIESNKYLSGNKLEKTKNFIDTKSQICDINDDIQDLIDSSLVITNDATHKIGKNHMMEIYKGLFPTKMKSPQTLLSNLKDKKITYDSQVRCDNMRGCYVGVKLKIANPFEDDDDCVDDEPDYKQMYLEANAKIKELQKTINKLNLDI